MYKNTVLSSLATAVQALADIAQSNPDHFFTTDWVMVDMNLHAYETRHKGLSKAMSELRAACGLKPIKTNYHHIKFLLLNFAQALRGPKPFALACPSSKDGVKDLSENPQNLTPALVKTLEAMERAGYVIKLSAKTYVRRSNQGGLKFSRFIPTVKLVSEIIEPFSLLKLQPEFIPSADFVLVSKKQTLSYGDEVRREVSTSSFKQEHEVRVIDESNQFLRPYNKLLQQTNITLEAEGFEGSQSKTVYRRFCRGRLDCGGRLYGGFWQQLGDMETGKSPNRQDILLNGERTVELDFKGLHINMLYAWEGMEPYVGDPYDIPGWPRSLVKSYILIALNAKGDGFQALRDKVRNDPALKPHYPLLLNNGCQRLKDAFAAKHPIIAKYLHSDAGVTLQYQDSQIAMRVIEMMMNLHKYRHAPSPIPVLCVHDSFIAPERWEIELEMCMIGAYEWIMKTTTAPIIEKLSK